MALMSVKTTVFFDRPAVIRAVSRAERQQLSKAGAFVRRRARSSIRKRKGVSKPGKPPSSHAGDLRRSIFFGFDLSSRSVVVGPRDDYGPGRKRNGQTVPELLEFGGRTTDRGRQQYTARPYMGPAMEAEADNFASLWRDSVRG